MALAEGMLVFSKVAPTQVQNNPHSISQYKRVTVNHNGKERSLFRETMPRLHKWPTFLGTSIACPTSVNYFTKGPRHLSALQCSQPIFVRMYSLVTTANSLLVKANKPQCVLGSANPSLLGRPKANR